MSSQADLPESDGPENYAQLALYLKQHSRSCLSYSLFQAGMQHYIEPDIGFIAYYPFWHPLLAPLGRKIILTNPVCPPQHARGMLERFIARYKRVIVLQCDVVNATHLSELGYEVNMVGQECELPLPYKLEGKRRATLRQWRNKCEREGVVVEERALSECDADEIKALSQEWMQDKGGKELILLTRPFVWADEPDVRCFWARQYGKLIGLAIFDPMYQDGKIVGYYHNFDRITAQAPNGSSAHIILEAMKVFEAEGLKVVSLGLMPLYVLRPHFKDNEFTRKALKYAYGHLNHLYPFQGSIAHKKKFGGRLAPVYLSSTQGNSMREVLITMKAQGMITSRDLLNIIKLLLPFRSKG